MSKSTPAYPAKNILSALGLLIFLALSFKLTGELTNDPDEITAISASDSVFNSLQTPAVQASAP